MHSTNGRKTNSSLKQIGSAALRRNRVGAAPKASMAGMAGLAVLVLLFFASLVYVALGGRFAVEASPHVEAESSIAGAAVITADAGAAGRIESTSRKFAQPAPSAPSGDVNPGLDADGNIRRYEDD
jgi:hypothetical protein